MYFFLKKMGRGGLDCSESLRKFIQIRGDIPPSQTGLNCITTGGLACVVQCSVVDQLEQQAVGDRQGLISVWDRVAIITHHITLPSKNAPSSHVPALPISDQINLANCCNILDLKLHGLPHLLKTWPLINEFCWNWVQFTQPLIIAWIAKPMCGLDQWKNI